MAKVSGAVTAIPILYVFFIKILETYKTSKKDILKIYGYIAIFAIISLPIGLWHPIRNYIMFNQPLGGILIPGQALYTGNFSILQRFIIPSFEETFKQLYCVIAGHHNVIATLIKTSILGEFTYLNLPGSYVTFFKMVNIIIILFTLISTFLEIVNIKKLKKKPLLIRICLIFYFALIASYIYFNIKYPYSCTMNFRYIMPSVFIGTLMLFDIINDINNENIEGFAIIMSILFCNLSIGMFFLI